MFSLAEISRDAKKKCLELYKKIYAPLYFWHWGPHSCEISPTFQEMQTWDLIKLVLRLTNRARKNVSNIKK